MMYMFLSACIVLRHVCGACTFLTAVSPLAVCVHAYTVWLLSFGYNCSNCTMS